MSAKERIPELFGSMVFNERTMEQYVPQEAMEVWRECLKQEKPLALEAANDIADAMKNWALEHGATHFTHWPLYFCERTDAIISFVLVFPTLPVIPTTLISRLLR